MANDTLIGTTVIVDIEEKVDMLNLYPAGISTTPFLITAVVIALLTCLGNVIILVASWKYPKLRCTKGRPMSALVVNLAISDLVHGALAIPFFAFPHYWIIHVLNSTAVCILHYVIFQYSMAVTVLTILAIAVKRYLAIVHPHWKPNKGYQQSLCSNYLILLCVWVYPAILIIALIATHTIDKTWTYCAMSLVLSNNYSVIMGIHLLVILIISTALYATTIRASRILGRRRRRSPNALDLALPTPLENGTASQNKKPSHTPDYRLQVTKNLIILMVIFCVCFMPEIIRRIIRIVMHFPSPEPAWLNLLDQFVMICLMLSSCLDPIVYSWRNKQLRNAIRHMFCPSNEASTVLSHSDKRCL